MNSKLVNKTVCLLVILAMVLTTFAVIPPGIADKDGKSTYKVNGSVYYGDGKDIEGATVILFNLHTGTNKSTVTNENGLFKFDKVEPGYYKLIAQPQNNNFRQTNASIIQIIEVNDNVYNLELILEKVFPPNLQRYTLEGFVINENSEFVENAIVKLKSLDYPGYMVTSTKTNETGGFSIEAYKGNYEVWATAVGDENESYQYTILQKNLIASEIYYNITLEFNETYLWGRVKFEGEPEDIEFDIYIYDMETSEFIIHHITGFGFNTKLYHGNFSLIIDSPGYIPYYHTEIIELNVTNNTYKVESPLLEKTNDETIKTSITFQTNDWNTIESNTVWTLNHDSDIYGLEYVNIGCPRFQLDIQPEFGGSTDGIVSGIVETDEVTGAKGFNAWLKDRGPYYMYTNDVFEVNNDHYGWKKSTFGVATNGFAGTYDSTTPMKITTNLNYNHLPGDELLNATTYSIKFNQFRANQVFALTLPNGYELSDVDSLNNNDNVWVQDFNKCQINSTATIVAEKITDPLAIITVRDKLGTIIEDELIVADVLENLTFDAMASEPGSGVIENYTWDLGDGTFMYGESVTHNYTDAKDVNVTLSITTTANMVSVNYTIIYVDDTEPMAIFEIQTETFVILPDLDGDGIPDGEEYTPTSYFNITFNATKSYDTIDGVESIEIAVYHWDFGDYKGGDTSNLMVATWAYDRPGVYDVNLTVTDYAGHSDTDIRKVNIKDMEAPIPQMFSDPIGRTCEIDKKLWLNATTSTDNSMPGATYEDILKNLTFKWDLDTSYDTDNNGILEDDVDAEGGEINFTEKFPGTLRPGPVHICLWVTDLDGNTANTTDMNPDEWNIDVVGVDLRFAPVDELTDKFIKFSEDKPKEGEKVKFTVNITNDGRVTAYDVLVSFFVDSKQTSTKTIGMLEQGHFELVEFSWKAKEVSKDHNISFNVSFENAQNLSFEQLWDNNYRSQKLEVLAPTPWIDTPCLIAIVIIVIIVIIIIIYFYRRRREEYGDIGKRRKEKDKGKSKGKGKSKSKGMEKEKSKQKKKGKKKD